MTSLRGSGDSLEARNAESSSEHAYTQTEQLVNQLLPGRLQLYLCRFPWGQTDRHTDRRGLRVRREQGLQHKHACLQLSVPGTKAGGSGHKSCLLEPFNCNPPTADIGHLDQFNTFINDLKNVKG